MSQNVSSAAVGIGALRIKLSFFFKEIELNASITAFWLPWCKVQYKSQNSAVKLNFHREQRGVATRTFQFRKDLGQF